MSATVTWLLTPLQVLNYFFFQCKSIRNVNLSAPLIAKYIINNLKLVQMHAKELLRTRHGPKPGCQEAKAFSILEAEVLTLFKLEAEAKAEALVHHVADAEAFENHEAEAEARLSKI